MRHNQDQDDDIAAARTLRDSESRRRFLKGIAAMSFMGTFAGCSGDGSGGGSPEPDGEENTPSETPGSGGDTPTDTSTPEETTDTAGESGTLNMNVHQNFGSLGPHRAVDYGPVAVRVNAYDHLVVPDSDGVLQPSLASDWTISEDSRTFTFTIREDATFHSGNDVTAEDVKFSVDRYFDINQGFSSTMKRNLSKENVEVTGDYEITMTLDQPFTPFLATLTSFAIVDRDLVMDNLEDGEFGDRGDYGKAYLNQNSAGGGAYELTDFEQGSGLTLTRFDDFWAEFPEGSYGTVNMDVVTEESTVRSLMRSGELHLTNGFHSLETYDALRDEPNVEIFEEPSTGGLNVKMNTQRSPTSDLNLRKAIAWGFDYGTAVEEAGGFPKAGPLVDSFDVHTDDIVKPEYDPQKAQQFLEQSGYSGETLQFVFVEGDSVRENMGLLMQTNMDDIGIDVELNGWPWSRVSDTAGSEDPTELPHMVAMYFGAVYPSPYAYLAPRYRSDADNTWANMERLNNEEVDSLITEIGSEPDPDTRAELYRELQIKVSELYPAVFIQSGVTRHAINTSVGGFQNNPAYGYKYAYRKLHHDDA